MDLRAKDYVRECTDDAEPPKLALGIQFDLGESAVAPRDIRNIFAPFAGFMLVGYEKQAPLEHVGEEEIDEAVEDVRPGGKATRNDIDPG